MALIHVDGDVLGGYLHEPFEHSDLRGTIILHVNRKRCTSHRSDSCRRLDLEARHLIQERLNSVMSFSEPLMEDDDLCETVSSGLHADDGELCLILHRGSATVKQVEYRLGGRACPNSVPGLDDVTVRSPLPDLLSVWKNLHNALNLCKSSSLIEYVVDAVAHEEHRSDDRRYQQCASQDRLGIRSDIRKGHIARSLADRRRLLR